MLSKLQDTVSAPAVATRGSERPFHDIHRSHIESIALTSNHKQVALPCALMTQCSTAQACTITSVMYVLIFQLD